MQAINDSYIFVSYAHLDRQRAHAVLNILTRRGFNIWFDAALEYGRDWYPSIIEHLEGSRAFLGFISRATEHRPVVIDEISRALLRKKQNPDYKVVFVLLERVSPEAFPEDIKRELKSSQFIDFHKLGGITSRFIDALTSVTWPEEVIDQDFRQQQGLAPWRPGIVNEEESFDNLFEFSDPMALLRMDAEEASCVIDHENRRFFKLSPEHIDRNTVYPVVMDNQWVSDNIYTFPSFYINGLTDPLVEKERLKRQRLEILKGLLHNWQIVINRAAMLNSRIFSNWYQPESPEYEDFRRLLKEAAIVLYLYKESSPVDFPEHFKISEKNKADWIRLCRSTPVYCLKFDWESLESNSYETAVNLDFVFQDFCLTLCENRYLLSRLAEALHLPGNRLPAFRLAWQKVQRDVQTYRDDKETNPDGKGYNRERFYKSFLINPELHTVDQGIPDLSKHEFVREFKQIIDMRYCLNLPQALGIQPLVPAESLLQAEVFSGDSAVQRRREISADELTFAVSEFHTDFINRDVWMPQIQDFSLSDILTLRTGKAWQTYMRILTEGKQRANLDQVDFSDAANVWERFVRFLDDARERLPEKNWRPQKGALTIMYHFEEIALTTVYTPGRNYLIRHQAFAYVSRNLNRKVNLNIDYVCGDIRSANASDLFLNSLRLFNGLTHADGFSLYKSILKKFIALGFEDISHKKGADEDVYK